jgi:hypothetical protein
MSVSKMMEEVWRWKDEVAKEIEGMTSKERIAYFRQAEQQLAEKTGGAPLNLRRRVRPQRKRPEGGT